MIILSTAVILEMINPKPHKTVLQWLDAQDTSQLYLTSLSVAELFAWVEDLPEDSPKTALASALIDMLNQDFAGRLLSFDAACALHYPRVTAASKQANATMAERETQLAAICLQHQASLATDHSARFTHTGITLINPWDVTQAPRWREEAAEYYVMSRKS